MGFPYSKHCICLCRFQNNSKTTKRFHISIKIVVLDYYGNVLILQIQKEHIGQDTGTQEVFYANGFIVAQPNLKLHKHWDHAGISHQRVFGVCMSS